MKSIVSIQILIDHSVKDDLLQPIVRDALIEHARLLNGDYVDMSIGKIGTHRIGDNVKVRWRCQRDVYNADTP